MEEEGESCDYYISKNGVDGINDIHGNPSLETTERIDYNSLYSDFTVNGTTSLDIINGELLPATDDQLFELDDDIHSQCRRRRQSRRLLGLSSVLGAQRAQQRQIITSSGGRRAGDDQEGELRFSTQVIRFIEAPLQAWSSKGRAATAGREAVRRSTPTSPRRSPPAAIDRGGDAGGRRWLHPTCTRPRLHVDGEPTSMLSTLTTEDMEDVELAHLLFSTAEKVGNREYDCAGRLLTYCERSASVIGNTLQRVVQHFASALRKRIDVKTRKKWARVVEEQSLRGEDITKKLVRPQPAIMALHRHLPISQLTQLTEVEVILDNVASSPRIHLIDLGIRFGPQWIGLMQALSTRTTVTMDLLRITAVGISKETITETRDRIGWPISHKTMNLPFAFEGIVLPDLKGWKEDTFPSPDSGESVVVYANTELNTLLDKPTCLGNLMRMIKYSIQD